MMKKGDEGLPFVPKSKRKPGMGDEGKPLNPFAGPGMGDEGKKLMKKPKAKKKSRGK